MPTEEIEINLDAGLRLLTRLQDLAKQDDVIKLYEELQAACSRYHRAECVLALAGVLSTLAAQMPKHANAIHAAVLIGSIDMRKDLERVPAPNEVN